MIRLLDYLVDGQFEAEAKANLMPPEEPPLDMVEGTDNMAKDSEGLAAMTAEREAHAAG